MKSRHRASTCSWLAWWLLMVLEYISAWFFRQFTLARYPLLTPSNSRGYWQTGTGSAAASKERERERVRIGGEGMIGAAEYPRNGKYIMQDEREREFSSSTKIRLDEINRAFLGTNCKNRKRGIRDVHFVRERREREKDGRRGTCNHVAWTTWIVKRSLRTKLD